MKNSQFRIELHGFNKELAIEGKFGMINSQESTGTFLGQWSFADTNTNLVVYHLLKSKNTKNVSDK